MFVVKNKETGFYIRNRSGSFNRNLWKERFYNKVAGESDSMWTKDISLAKVYSSKAGIKNSIGSPKRDSKTGNYIRSNNKRRNGTFSAKMFLPDWAEIVPIKISTE